MDEEEKLKEAKKKKLKEKQEKEKEDDDKEIVASNYGLHIRIYTIFNQHILFEI